jgi:hypothetical protein
MVRIPDGPGGSGDPLGTATGLGGSGDGCLVVRMMISLAIWAGSRLAAVSGAADPEGRPGPPPAATSTTRLPEP